MIEIDKAVLAKLKVTKTLKKKKLACSSVFKILTFFEAIHFDNYDFLALKSNCK